MITSSKPASSAATAAAETRLRASRGSVVRTRIEGWPRSSEIDGYLDTRRGDPLPDLVVEIDRSVDSSHKLAPYFRMGVREAWTWGRRDGARIWVADHDAPLGFGPADESVVLPKLARSDLDRLLAAYRPSGAARELRDLARRVARAILERSEARVPSRRD